MQLPDPNRREFTQWAAAAVGGLLAGLSVGRAVAADEPKMKDPKKPLLLQEPHICLVSILLVKANTRGRKTTVRAKPTVRRSRNTSARGTTTVPAKAAAARPRREQVQEHGRMRRAAQRQDLGEGPQELRGRHEEGGQEVR